VSSVCKCLAPGEPQPWITVYFLPPGQSLRGKS
jgi:hypothetical protein